MQRGVAVIAVSQRLETNENHKTYEKNIYNTAIDNRNKVRNVSQVTSRNSCSYGAW